MPPNLAPHLKVCPNILGCNRVACSHGATPAWRHRHQDGLGNRLSFKDYFWSFTVTAALYNLCGVSPPNLDENNLGGFKLRVNTTCRKKK